MALKFVRKGFKSGLCKVIEMVQVEKEELVAGEVVKKLVDEPVVLLLKPSDLGKSFEFKNEDAVLAQYPVLFEKV